MRPRRSTLRRLFKGGLILGSVLVVLVLATPSILSMDWARTQLERALSESLHTDVRIASYGFGWFSGLSIDGVAVANPEGFPPGQQLFEMRSLRGDASFVELVRGRFEVSGVVDGVVLRVVQRQDGTTNIGELIGVRPEIHVEPDRPGSEPDKRGGPDLANLRIDLELRDAFVEVVHEERGVLERLEKVNARLSKEFGAQVVRVEFACDLDRPGSDTAKGRIEFRLDAEADPSRPIDAHLNCIGVDLSRYRPLLASFVPDDQLTAFAGVVSANVRITGVPTDELTVVGTVEVEQPHFAGPMLKGMDLSAPRWTLRPNVTASVPSGDELPEVDISRLEADLGFMSLKGLPGGMGEDGVPDVGIAFEIDVATLAEAGGPIPEILRGTGSTMRGEVRLPLRADLAELEPADLLARVALDCAIAVGELRFAEQVLSNLAADVELVDGRFAIATSAGTFNGGALEFRLETDTTKLDTLPVSFSVGVSEAKLGGRAVQALQYAVPLLAGLDSATAEVGGIDFASLGTARLEFSGPAFPREGQPILEWLNGWTGTGQLALDKGAFRPAPALAGLLQLTGESGRLSFGKLATSFRLDQGFVDTGLMELSAHGRKFGIQGRTSLSGVIDHVIDAREMLRGHADGEKILKYLGDKPVGARLTGSLDAPVLALPDIQTIAMDAIRNAIEQEGRERVEKEAGDLLDRIFGDRTKGAQEGGPEDAARRALEDLLGIPGAKAPGSGEGERGGQPGPKQDAPKQLDPKAPSVEDAVRKAAENLLRGLGGGKRTDPAKKEGGDQPPPKEAQPEQKPTPKQEIPKAIQDLLRGFGGGQKKPPPKETPKPATPPKKPPPKNEPPKIDPAQEAARKAAAELLKRFGGGKT